MAARTYREKRWLCICHNRVKNRLGADGQGWIFSLILFNGLPSSFLFLILRNVSEDQHLWQWILSPP